MSWAVNNVAGSLAGTQNAASIAKRSIDKKKPVNTRKADRDEFNHVAEATEVEHAEAVRSLKDNSQEEAHEDRREHGGQAERQIAEREHEMAEDRAARGRKPTVYTQGASIRAAANRSSRGLDLRG